MMFNATKTIVDDDYLMSDNLDRVADRLQESSANLMYMLPDVDLQALYTIISRLRSEANDYRDKARILHWKSVAADYVTDEKKYACL